jgi:outer membrane protein OmpA-like peptidoglycan-associated protein
MQKFAKCRAAPLALAGVLVAIVLGGCASEPAPAPKAQTSVATVSTFDLATADADEIGAALHSDGRVVIRGITFETDSADLSGASYASVTRLGNLMNADPSLRVAVVGHTDNTGKFAYNMSLSERRAQAVAKAMQEDFDIAPDRLAAVGVGPLAPINSNKTDYGRSQNRRIELVIIE